MKTLTKIGLTLILGGAMSINPSFGQSTAEELDINSVSGRFIAGGGFWWEQGSQRHFEVPNGSGLHTLFASSLWVGGQDISGDLHVAAERFRSNGRDYWPGPIADAQHYDPFGAWNRLWKVTRAEINDHIANHNQQGYVMPEAIENWPAHGDLSKGEAQLLAPFVDLDGDGQYKPENGDYPDVLGDMTVYSIFNDDYDDHGETGASKLKMEVHLMAYAFDCGADQALDHTIFLNFRMINRSTFSYQDTYLGFWTDADLGNPIDDYTGCDVERGAYYFYNGDIIDESAGGNSGYGQNPPAQAVVFLAGPHQDDDGIDNQDGVGAGESVNGVGFGDGVIDNERLGLTGFLFHLASNTPRGDPSTGDQYYNYLRGHWRDTNPMTYGGTGYDPGNPNSVEAKFMFPGLSDPLGYGTGGVPQPDWTETTSGNTPDDRRGMGSCGPFTFGANAEVQLDLAMVYSRSTNTDPLGPSVASVLGDVDHIREVFFTNTSACGGVINSTEANATANVNLMIAPNPADETVTLTLTGANPTGNVVVMDVTGKRVLSEPLTQTQQSLNIGELQAGLYFVRWETSDQNVTQRLIVR